MNKKLIKFIKIFLFNIIAIGILWVLSDICLYITSLKMDDELSITNLKKFYKKPLSHIYIIEYFFDIKNNIEENFFLARKPDGIVYKTSPILLFGCSYAYGLFLNYNQTFSYKLANQIKRPVYNRAIPGFGLQQMHYQTTTDEFYKSVPKCDTVISVIISDHFRRMLGEPFHIYDAYLLLHYKYKDDHFIMDNYDKPLVIFYKHNYTLRAIRKIYNYYYLHNPKNFDKITDEALAYFIKTRENLENHWHNKIKFVVFFYRPYMYEDILMKKLRNNNFYAISSKDLTPENLFNSTFIDHEHPNEAAWDLLTPLFVEKMKQEKVF
ncbi:hypothetical protein IJG14_01610 [bacterium]|nr:hypothetical protein [bacterium]